jgi:hypothetical protein
MAVNRVNLAQTLALIPDKRGFYRFGRRQAAFQALQHSGAKVAVAHGLCADSANT